MISPRATTARRSGSSERPADSRGVDRRRLCSLVLVAAAVLAAAGSLAYLAYFGWQWSRPGNQHYLKGLDYLAARKPERAEAEWILGVQQSPKDYRNYEQLGDYYSTLHRTADAAACYAKAAMLHPTDPTLFYRLAQAHQQLGDFPGAARAAYRAAALAPNDARVMALYGILEAKNKARRMAIAALTRACELAPANGQYRIAKALSEMDVLDFGAAEVDLRIFLKAHPHDPEASYYMSVLYNQKARTPANLAASIGYAQTALAGRPRDIRCYAQLGQLYLDSGRAADALTIFRQARVIAPFEESVIHGLADCYDRLGMNTQKLAADQELTQLVSRRDRIEHLKHVMGYNHFDTRSALELAGLETLVGNDNLARVYYEQLIRQSPRDMVPRQKLSALYTRMGRPNLARIALRTDMVP